MQPLVSTDAASAIADSRRVLNGRSIRWNADRAAEYYAIGWWSRKSLATRLTDCGEATPDRVVLIDGEQELTCAELARDAGALAGAMQARLAPGSVVSFMLPNWREAAVVYFAATLAGMVVNPILPSLGERDLAFLLADANCAMIFAPGRLRERDYPAMLDRACAGMADRPNIVVVRDDPASGRLRYADMIAEDRDVAPSPTDPDGVHLIMHTSGTTGLPKGVLHSQNSLRALILQLGRHWLIAPGDTFLVPSPISHIGGSIYAFEMPLMLGTAAMLMERWDAAEAVSLARRRPFTHLAGATPFLRDLVSAAKQADDRLPYLKLFVCGGASVPPALVIEAAEHFESAVVTRVYGSTEVPVITIGTVDRTDVNHAAATDGRIGISEVKFVTHVAASRICEGEIWARGPQMLIGYLHEADEAGLFDRDGFYRTGDLGCLLDVEFLAITGRSKDIIIRNGENISAKEIEDLLIEHPGIAEIAIVGVTDAKVGERACAVIVARESHRPDVAEVGALLNERGVARFKHPERVEIWPSLPKNATGKILKHEIRAALSKAGQ